jgi:hypothetical protein
MSERSVDPDEHRGSMLDTGYWILDTGCWILDVGCRSEAYIPMNIGVG